MIKTLTHPYNLIFIIFCLLGCKNGENNKVDTTPNYLEYDNDWEEKNLFGEVKSITEYKVNFKATGKIDNINPTSTIEFTKYGAIKKLQYFSTFGDTLQIDEYHYDQNHYLEKHISDNIAADRKLMRLIENDSINKSTTQIIVLNDSIIEKFIFYYDDNDRVTKSIEIKKTDTIIINHKYKLDSKGRIILETHTRQGKEDNPDIINEFKYDTDNNLIRNTHKFGSTELITETEWEKGRILTQKHFIIYPDETKHLDEVYEFDKFYNPTNIKNFLEMHLVNELRNEYEFDKNGNWITKTVYLKQYDFESSKFEKAFVETRKIEYWK